MKKINPRRVPVTLYDLERAKKEAMTEAVIAAYTIMFSVLLDKHAAPIVELQQLWDEVEELSDSIQKGYVNISDLRHALKEEAGIEFE